MIDLADTKPSPPGRTVRFPGVPAIVDGSEAIAHVETRISEVACAYPITPSTTMAAVFQSAVAAGHTNLWGTPLAFIEPESEHSSASAAEGVALAGGRVTNFTAGQGLILMKEVLYVLSGKRLPAVFHVGARALTSQALNIHAGHDDVMGIADTGWGILFARNAQEAADLTAIARRAAEETRTPFFVVQDGFLTTHTLENVRLPEDELLRSYVGDPRERIDCLFDPDTALMTGVVQNQDSYMKGRIGQRAYYAAVPAALTGAMNLWAQETGRRYGDIEAYRCDDADEIIVAMGTIADTARAVVDVLRRDGRAVGAVGIISYRPFPADHLAEVLQDSKVVAIVERTDEPAAADNPLTRETKSALYARAADRTRVPRVVSVSAGLGSRDVDAADLAGVFDWARGIRPGDARFGVVGVRHPLAVRPRPIDISPAGSFALRGHSIGGLGSITTNKLLATVMGEVFGKQVQAYPRYGSEKKGLPTSYSLTIADDPIRGHGELRQVHLVSLHDVSAFELGDPLAGLVDGGTVYVQSPLTDAAAIWASIPAPARAEIVRRRIRVTALDTAALARSRSPRPDLILRLQGVALVGAFLRMTSFAVDAGMDRDAMLAAVGARLRRFYGKRGDDVLTANLAMVASAFDGLIDVSDRLGLEAGPRREILKISDQVASARRGDAVNPIEPAFDVRTYVEEFESAVVPAYLTGRADAEWPADAGLARSIIPPGTAASRDFSHLAPHLPQFVAERCVGCMACVSACPDSALIARVVPEADVAPAVARFGAEDPAGGVAATDLLAQFVRTKKYAEVPERNGTPPGAFGLFVEPTRCKGCGECVEVCVALGHDALFMTDKVEGDRDEPSTLDRAATMIRFLRSLPPTPEMYRNEKALADLMLGEDAFGYIGGAGSCAGCGEATAIRMMVAATRQVHGPTSMGIVAATGCNTVFGSTYPFNPYLVPWTNSLFENAPAVAAGIRRQWDQTGHADRRLWVMGGDGAMYDIGFQALSRMVASGADIKVLVLDTQVYSNTGGQASTASFGGQVTKLSAFGAAQHGRPEARKELGRILMAHGDVYVAQTTPAHVNHFYRSILEANEFPGPAVVISYAACMPEHGIADDTASRQARLAVESRAFPLFTYDPRRGPRVSDRLSLQGNPAIRDDWSKTPAGETVDFLSFARSEGRFAPHFGPAGEPTTEIQATNEDRLANWRTLQELAGHPGVVVA